MNLWKVLGVLVLWNSLCWFVIGLLIAPVVPGGVLTVVAAAALVLLPALIIARNIGGGGYPSAFTRRVVFRFFWYAQLLLPILVVAAIVGVLVGLPFGAAGTFGRWTIAGIAALYLVMIVWGYIGASRLRVRHLEIPFANLPHGLDGMTIVQLSDLHVGPHTSRRHLRRIADAVRNAEPHLIAITGDQVDDYARDTEPFASAFAELSAPLGVVAIVGNHDVYAGWGAVRRGLENMGITVIVNDAIPIDHNGERFWLACTGDPAGKGWQRDDGGAEAAPDIDATLANVPPDAFTIALAHNPALWRALAERGVDLTLSGHTHYGQFAFPRFGWSLASMFLEHAMDMHRKDGAVLYINPGTNYWGIPFRIGALPEVTVVTLRIG